MDEATKTIRLQMIAEAVEKVNNERNQQSDEFKLDEINEQEKEDGLESGY